MLEMAEKVEMEPFDLFDKIPQTNLSNLKNTYPKDYQSTIARRLSALF